MNMLQLILAWGGGGGKSHQSFPAVNMPRSVNLPAVKLSRSKTQCVPWPSFDVKRMLQLGNGVKGKLLCRCCSCHMSC